MLAAEILKLVRHDTFNEKQWQNCTPIYRQYETKKPAEAGFFGAVEKTRINAETP
ncbi:MAG: hypothetical protein ACK4QP_05585 [Pseudorhizobium sp.]